jgi:hypothetical protein
MSKIIINLANFNPKGLTGQMFAKARLLNQINEQLSQQLPTQFKSLSLSAVDEGVATFVTHNQALAFRAQKQSAALLNVITKMESLASIQKVVIKIDLKEY